MGKSDVDEPPDALGVITVQDGIIGELLQEWREATERLSHGDEVDVRWKRGSAVKLVLQHFAVRESAKEAVAGRLREADHSDLADALEGDGVRRREAIDHLDELVRGHQAITLNTPEVDRAVEAVGEFFDRERPEERDVLVARAEGVLGPPGERGLPSARHIRIHSTTHPSPVPRWFDQLGPVKALRAFYEHLRLSPSGGTAPSVDDGREHLPGPRP